MNWFSPEEVFSGPTFCTQENPSIIREFHTFGCPVLVLNSQLSDGKSIPKFDPRVRTCIFVRWSKEHASTVALVLDPKTDHISTKFYVILDNNFETVASPTSLKSDILNIWENIVKTYQKEKKHVTFDLIQDVAPPFKGPESTAMTNIPKSLDDSSIK